MGGLEELSREDLLALVLAQAKVIEELRAEVAELKRQLGQNSANSSFPPSSDKFGNRTPPRSLRGKSGRKPGKQPGAPGSALEMVADPDETIDHYPQACWSCEQSLQGAAEAGVVRRQVHDLPQPRVVVTEHRLHKRHCGAGRSPSPTHRAASPTP